MTNNLEILKFSPNERVITQGEKADKAYMVLSGKVRVYLEEGSKIVELAELGEDQIFGESSIFSDVPYGANVDAVEDSELYVITPDALTEMMQDAGPILRAMVQMLIERLKKTNEALLKSETREYIDVALI